MLFSSDRTSFGAHARVCAPSRHALLIGTILGSGAFAVVPSGARAADYIISSPSNSGFDVGTLGSENLTFTVTATGSITAAVNGSTSGTIKATTAEGNITLTLDGDVTNPSGTGYAVYAKSTGAGSITLTGAGNLIGVSRGFLATTSTGAITIGGSGSSSASSSFSAINATISSSTATSDILINRSGAMSGSYGINATNNGSGKITIQGIGAVTATNIGINSSAQSGATSIDLTNNVTAHVSNTSGAAISATSTSGAITIKTASGVALSSDTTAIYAASSADGNIRIGDATTGLGGAVNGTSGVIASTTGTGTIDVKTASGGSVTASNGNGIQTTAVSGATMIDLAGSVSSTGTSATASAVTATATGTGGITVKTTAGAAINASGGTLYTAGGIVANSRDGNVDIGGATGLAGAITADGKRAFGVYASSSTGNITIKTASGADINASAKGTSGTRAAYGVVGVAAGTSAALNMTLGANVTATDAGTGSPVDEIYGVFAQTTAGTLNITTMAGVAVTSATAIKTISGIGGQTINIGGGSTISGSVYAIDAASSPGGDSSNGFIKGGNATVNNAGIVKGSIRFNPGTADAQFLGTGTFNNAGTLFLRESQSNSGFALNNLSGGVLTGAGSFGAVNAASGSTIQAGDRTIDITSSTAAQRTFTASSLTLASGAIVDVRADYSGVADKVAVTGAAALNGATLKILASPKTDATWADKKTFTVLTAGSITGTFADTIQTDYAFLKFTAAYTATGVSVTSDRNWTSFGTYAKTSNQKSVSDVFDKLQTQLSNPVINRVSTLTVSQATNALSQLSGTGTVATRTQAFGAGNVFAGAINTELGRFNTSAGGASSALSYAEETKIKSKAFDKIAPKPEPVPDGRIWAQILGGIGNMKSDATNPSQRASNYGLAAGADTDINANLRAGVALSLGQSSTKVSSLATSTESVWGQGALYGVATDGDTYLKGALTFGYLDNKSDRTVNAFGTNDQAKGKFGASLYSLRLEAGQKFAFAPVNLTPFIGFEPSLLVQNAYKETGPASITLGFDRTTSRALPTILGGKIDAAYDLGDYRMTPSASLGWVHDFANSGSISPYFTSLPGSSFTAQGSRGDRNLARTEVNLEASPKGTLATIYLNARADVGSRTNAVRGVAGVSLRF